MSNPLRHNPLDNNPLEIFQPMPAYSTVLGICEDGLPLFWTMNDPDPGAILISGQRNTGKCDLMKSILISACNSIVLNSYIFT